MDFEGTQKAVPAVTIVDQKWKELTFKKSQDEANCEKMSAVIP